MLIANDADYKRTHMLVHQTGRMPSKGLMVTNLDAGQSICARSLTDEQHIYQISAWETAKSYNTIESWPMSREAFGLGYLSRKADHPGVAETEP
jgi:hypothetical protein